MRPELSESLILKHLPPAVTTAKGHLKHEKQGLQSTFTIYSITTDMDMYPPPDEPNFKSYDVIYAITSKENKAFMDLTGRFPHCSSRGNRPSWGSRGRDGWFIGLSLDHY